MNLIKPIEQLSMFAGTPSGFRLRKLEVYNWGTFDKQVWGFYPDGETALLTGDVGSGKSTLVDALTTLLVAPRKIAYNKAADATAKERTLNSYVRGYFGQKKSTEGTNQPDALRDTNHYSVLLATFEDQGLNQFVTLAIFMWYQSNPRHPERFYVVAEREMSITTDFANFDRDVRVLKKNLKSSNTIQVFDDYTRYSACFRRIFGIAQEQALDLFQQTISMKKVEALTDFVRENMLESPDIHDDIEKLIKHFSDLNSAHGAVLKAKNQIQLLQPIMDRSDRYALLDQKRALFGKAQRALSSWFAEQEVALLHDEITCCKEELDFVTAEHEQASIAFEKIEQHIKETERAISENGGDALERLKQEIESDKNNLKRISKDRSSYEMQAEKVKLPKPLSLEIFIKNLHLLPALKSEEGKKHAALDEERINAITEKNDVQQSLNKTLDELESLRSRKSSIPRAHIEKRAQLCRSLSINEEALPFIGELLEVDDNETPWEGAIERLMHNFGMSLLVPNEHYSSVAKWVDKESLGLRLVYYRVQLDEVRKVTSQPNHPQSVSEKINIKPHTPFGFWLDKELRYRFPHICCEDINQFRRESQAITKTGQIKSQGNRHEKDDRHSINDRKRFILGFSNQKKIAALEESEMSLKEDLKFYDDMITQYIKEQAESQNRRNALEYLEQFDDYEAINTRAKEKEIEEKEARRKKLEQENDVLKGLICQLDNLENQKDKQKGIVEEKLISKIEIENCLKGFHKRNESSKSTAMEATPETREFVYPFLQQHSAVVFNATVLTLDNGNKLQGDYYKWLSEEQEKLVNDITNISNKIVRQMTEYKNEYVSETKDIDASLQSLPEFKKILNQLEIDALPNFESRFKRLLHENTINQIALFQAKLKKEQDTIINRIKQINHSLSAIDYNEGRYIRLEHEETYDSEIKEFRNQLKACTEGALTGSDDDQYAEAKFLQVKAIIDRFIGRLGETELDNRWTKKVTDVRNWFLFAASERWRETDEEYEHYKDSGGKSGGQKEKLAYTILAASLVYHFGLEEQDVSAQSFRFVVIDEAFLKSSDESARFGLELFKKLDLQLMIVTPLLKIPTIAQYIAHVGFVHHDDVRHKSMLRNITIEEYVNERKIREAIRNVQVV